MRIRIRYDKYRLHYWLYVYRCVQSCECLCARLLVYVAELCLEQSRKFDALEIGALRADNLQSNRHVCIFPKTCWYRRRWKVACIRQARPKYISHVRRGLTIDIERATTIHHYWLSKTKGISVIVCKGRAREYWAYQEVERLKKALPCHTKLHSPRVCELPLAVRGKRCARCCTHKDESVSHTNKVSVFEFPNTSINHCLHHAQQ